MRHEIVSQEEWLAARKAYLAKEKEFTRLRDELSAERRALPWTRVEKTYVFDGPAGRQTLPELFEGRSQLIVYHFMLGPGWEQGCKSCSFLADHIDGALVHLAHRDVTLVAVSRAPSPEIEAFKKRMGWHFQWVSSFGSDFNADFHISFSPDELAKGEVYYKLRHDPLPERGGAGGQRLLQGPGWHRLPHLLGLCARARHARRHLQLPRPRAEGARRGGAALDHGLGAAPRPIRPRTRSRNRRSSHGFVGFRLADSSLGRIIPRQNGGSRPRACLDLLGEDLG